MQRLERRHREHGCQLVYDDEAVAREETPPDVADEFKRRARIGAVSLLVPGAKGSLKNEGWWPEWSR